MIERVRCVLFDLEGTLAAYRERPILLLEVAKAYAPLIQPTPPEFLAERLESAFASFWKAPSELEAWRRRVRAARHHVVARVFLELSPENPSFSPELAGRFAEDFHRRKELQMAVPADVRDAVVGLKKSGLRLGLVTDGADLLQREKVTAFGLAELFDFIQLEEECERSKPDPAYFESALSALRVGANEALMVGDDVDLDLIPARAAGIHPIWVDPTIEAGASEKDGFSCIGSVRELPDWLTGLRERRA